MIQFAAEPIVALFTDRNGKGGADVIRLAGQYLTSQLFPTTLFPMGLATATGSLLSVVICGIAFTWIRHNDRKISLGG